MTTVSPRGFNQDYRRHEPERRDLHRGNGGALTVSGRGAGRGPDGRGIKSWPQFFELILCWEKTHELRRNDDRDFRVGDLALPPVIGGSAMLQNLSEDPRVRSASGYPELRPDGGS